MTIHLSKALRPEGHLAEGYWRMRVAELGSACCISEPAGEADGIREAFHLLMLAPPGLLSQWKVQSSHERIDAMLAAGAGESAALSILPPGAGYMLSRSANGLQLTSRHRRKARPPGGRRIAWKSGQGAGGEEIRREERRLKRLFRLSARLRSQCGLPPRCGLRPFC